MADTTLDRIASRAVPENERIGAVVHWQTIARSLLVGVVLLVSMTATHNLLTFGTSAGDSVLGAPNLPLLFVMAVVQGTLMAVAYSLVQAAIPVDRGWLRGLVFGALFAAGIQIPGVFGMVVIEPGPAWDLFTPGRMVQLVTIVDDTLAMLVVGIAIGVLLPRRAGHPNRRRRRTGLAMAAAAVAFPTLLAAVETAVMQLPRASGSPLAFDGSLWFNASFFGPFALTGLLLPLLHGASMSGQATRWRRVLRTLLVFGLCWMPFQNFMIVWGWGALGGIVFSLVSLIPAALVAYLSDRLLGLPSAGAGEGAR